MTLRIASLASGSSGNATYVEAGETGVLVDCGTSARTITERLAVLGIPPTRIRGILITHAHSDHYRAAGTLNARYGIPVYADPSVSSYLSVRGRHTSWKRIREVHPLPDSIGALGVEAHDTSHGFDHEDLRSVCFVLRSGGKGVGIATDLGRADGKLGDALRGLDSLLIEANYDEGMIARKLSDPQFAVDWNYLAWVAGDRGHLSNRQCAEFLSSVVSGRTKHILLGHMSHNHRDPAKDNNSVGLAMREVERALGGRGAFLPQLHATHRIGLEPGEPGPLIEV